MAGGQALPDPALVVSLKITNKNHSQLEQTSILNKKDLNMLDISDRYSSFLCNLHKTPVVMNVAPRVRSRRRSLPEPEPLHGRVGSVYGS